MLGLAVSQSFAVHRLLFFAQLAHAMMSTSSSVILVCIVCDQSYHEPSESVAAGSLLVGRLLTTCSVVPLGIPFPPGIDHCNHRCRQRDERTMALSE